ncbi:MAG: XRE family transcriptional regulator [Spirochaetaceae bacterium]|jgi:mannose-6-phosphate isomerase-like protein (cupin superfamily)/DNA-binding XRE family transcriptional regulator|nr:XRE family transcriptional regulator [Spirochaetaceae bacterium]
MATKAAKRNPGERIIELCKTYSISRETLAERSGLDPELIRRIEEEGHIPDLAPLLKISRALGVRLGTLLDDHEELGPVITRNGEASGTVRFITGNAGGGAGAAKTSGRGHYFHALAADKSSRHMEPFIVNMEHDEDQPKSSHEGEEFIYVLEGTIQVEYGKDSYTINQGDSIYYDSIVPHRVFSSGGPAGILAVIYTPA